MLLGGLDERLAGDDIWRRGTMRRGGRARCIAGKFDELLGDLELLVIVAEAFEL